MMVSSYPLWWLALPVLLLPIWWHRQKRQRMKAELLATARFLPSASPEQVRVWQWRDKALLLVRCLLLVTLIAWLAATIFPWRGDTVLVDEGADKAWTEQQIAAAGLASATRIALAPNALQWLRTNERDWRPSARLLIVARAGQIAMPARVPQFSHTVEVRTAPQSAAGAAPRVEQYIAVAATADHATAWQSLFAAFDVAGNAAARYKLSAEPDANTTLIVWDTPATTPPASWRAANWWIASADPATRGDVASGASPAPAANATRAAFPELANASTLALNGITMKYADSARGRLWTSDAFPPRDADTARALYESWQQLSDAPSPSYAMPSQIFGNARSALPAITDARPAYWLALALLAFFIIERILTHARRT